VADQNAGRQRRLAGWGRWLPPWWQVLLWLVSLLVGVLNKHLPTVVGCLLVAGIYAYPWKD
jgi:hypothetical protein